MQSFVKVNNGTFPNLNFYMAWEGLNTMGYSVTLFEEKDIDNLPITKDTPVFAGVTVFKRIVDKLGVNYQPFNCYPDVLQPCYGRSLKKSTLGEERRKFQTKPTPVFVKPVLPKQFTGDVWTSILQLIPIARVPDNVEVWVCDPIKISSEYRCYVHDGDIVGVKHYYGDWSVTPDKSVVEYVVKAYKPCPIAYGIDFAVLEQSLDDIKAGKSGTIVLEVNDGCNLGNYGVDSIHYGEMIVSRWFEIMSEGNVNNAQKYKMMLGAP